MANPLVTCVAEMYGTNHPQLKQSMCHTRVVFVSHICCFRGVGGCLATQACGYMHVHAQILHTRVTTHTQNVYTRVLFASVT